VREAPVEVVEVRAARDGIELAGSVWATGGAPRGLVLMHPGSGPSDRDNDVLFPPIRSALLDAGVAVCSFDKRGVGESTGSWLDAGIEEQASDVRECVRVARAVVPGGPLGLFGHSQGGWVVLEASRHMPADFVITNSGPSVSPRAQEIYSTGCRLRERRWRDDRVREGVATIKELFDLIGSGRSFEDARRWMAERAALMKDLAAAGVFVPEDEPTWTLAAAILYHDPRAALRGLTVALLALLGERDAVVPVEDSAAVFRACVRPDLLDLYVVSEGGHRMCPPGREEFVPGYLAKLTSFVAARLGADVTSVRADSSER
jgi:hypothetical protein